MIKNRKELLEFEKKLIKLKEQLFKQREFTNQILLRPQGESAGESSSYRTHVGDIGTEAYQREIISQLTTYESKMLMEIESALQKIRQRKYGNCERCNKAISKVRLKAIPYTRTCIKCQKELSGR